MRLRVFAIILVVLGHIFDGYYNSGIFPEHFVFIWRGYNLIYSFHMPLFFMLSGFVYEMAYFSESHGLVSASNKVRFRNQIIRLVYLYLLWGVIMDITKTIFADGVNNSISWYDILKLPIKFMAPYWYLYVLVMFYLVFMLLRNVDDRVVLAICAIATVVGNVINAEWMSYVNLYHFMTDALYFYIGVLLSRRHSEVTRHRNLMLAAGISLVMFTVFFEVKNIDGLTIEVPVIGTICALGVCCFLWNAFRRIRFTEHSFLARIGKASLEIYLIHCFFTAGNRTIFAELGIDNFYISVILNLIISIAGSLIIAEIAKKIHLYDIFFSGKIVTQA